MKPAPQEADKESASQQSSETAGTLKFLSTLSRDIALTSESLGPSLDTLLTRAARETKTDALAVWTIDEGGDALSIHHSVGLSERFIRYFNHTDRIRLAKGIIGRSASEAATYAIENPASWNEFGPTRWKTMFSEEGIATVLVVPMRIGDRPIGTLTALHRGEHVYSLNEHFLFEVLANQIAIALANYGNYLSISKSQEKLTDQIVKLTSLQDSFQAINRYLNQSIEHALAFLARYARETFHGLGVVILELNEQERVLAVTGSAGLPKDFEKRILGLKLPIDGLIDTLVLRAFKDMTPQLSERLFTDDRIGKRWVRLLSENHITAEAAFPLLVENRALGVLAVFYDHLHPYSDEEKSVLGAFSQFFGILFENQKIFASLLAEKQKTQAIVYSLRDGLLVYDIEGVVTDANPRALELLGVSKEDILGHNPLIEEKRIPGFANVTSTSRLAIPDFEVRVLKISYPEDRTIEVTQVPLHEESYKKTGTLRVLHDVTEEERSKFLKTNFVTTATHQLRTPLTGINWGLNELSGNAGNLTESQGKILDQLKKTTTYIISLVNDLLSVSEIEEGRVQYNFRHQNLRPLIQKLIDELSVEIQKKNITFSFKVPSEEEGLFATVDETRFLLALQNILDNAVQYTPEGKNVSIQVENQKNSIIVSVIDSGIGISKEDQRLLFNKFFRGSNAARAVPNGSGLGLFLAKQIIEGHNGKIWVDSTLGKGSAFHIQLPLEEALLPKNGLT